MEKNTNAPSPDTVKPYAWYALGVMTLVYAINFVDRQIMSILAEDIKADLGLSDAQLGFLYGTSFAIFYSLFGIPLGRLADNWKRGQLMALGLVVWSTMTALSGFATSYAQLAMARIGVGIGEASASPAAFSMLADYFPKRRRALAMSIYSAGLYVGMGLSLPIGGWIAETWNRSYPDGSGPLGFAGWQAAFVIVSIPGLLMAPVVLALREPMRGEADGDPQHVVKPGAWSKFGWEMAAILPPLTLWSVSRIPGGLRTNLAGAAVIAGAMTSLTLLTGDVAQWCAYGVGLYAVMSWVQVLRTTDKPTYALIWGTPTVWFCLLGFGGLAFFTYAYSFWVAPFAIRTMAITASSAGAYIGIPGAIASAVGVIIGGRLSDAWKARDPRGRVFVAMLSMLLPTPVMLLMFNTADFRLFAILSPAVFLLSNMWVGSAITVYQDFVLPRMRGVAGATYLLGSTLVGLALGPYFVGRVATTTGSLSMGILSLYVIAPVVLVALYAVSRNAADVETTKNQRAIAAGEVKA